MLGSCCPIFSCLCIVLRKNCLFFFPSLSHFNLYFELQDCFLMWNWNCLHFRCSWVHVRFWLSPFCSSLYCYGCSHLSLLVDISFYILTTSWIYSRWKRLQEFPFLCWIILAELTYGVYISVDSIFQCLWFILWFLLKRGASTDEANS